MQIKARVTGQKPTCLRQRALCTPQACKNHQHFFSVDAPHIHTSNALPTGVNWRWLKPLSNFFYWVFSSLSPFPAKSLYCQGQWLNFDSAGEIFWEMMPQHTNIPQQPSNVAASEKHHTGSFSAGHVPHLGKT